MSVRVCAAGAVGGGMLLWGALCVATGLNAADQPNPQQDEPEGGRVEAFMRAKLSHAQSVLEGLVTEDYDKIKLGGQRMVIMSKAAEWSQVQGPVYAQHSTEFRRAAQNLIKTAEDKNIDGAALAYVNLTLNCVNCHNYIRDAKVAAGEPVPEGLKLALQPLPR